MGVLWSWSFGPGPLVLVLWSRSFGPGPLLPVLWSRSFGPGPLLPVLWSRSFGPGPLVPVLWSRFWEQSTNRHEQNSAHRTNKVKTKVKASPRDSAPATPPVHKVKGWGKEV